ncbi:hypothetical protein TNCV_862671 [Trichonephila clavipes]|nr:hypothetical protein TNCV_862671 [Trichonephila clavipes]
MGEKVSTEDEEKRGKLSTSISEGKIEIVRVTLNSSRATSPIEWLMEGPWLPPGCSTSKLGWNRAKSYCYLHGAQS